MADVFVSYKQSDRATVDVLVKRLRSLNLSVWFDASIDAGDSFNDEIDREARASKAILVCWSPAARESRWVKAEAMIGFEKDKLAACYIAGPNEFSAPTPFNAVHAEDLREWLTMPNDTHEGWKSILRRVGRLAGRSDIVSWGSLYGGSSIADLRAWIGEHSESPLFPLVDAQLTAREDEETERERAIQEAREKRAREARERRERELAEQRERDEAVRRAEEAAELERREEQAAHEQSVREETESAARKAIEDRRLTTIALSLFWLVTLGVLGGAGWFVYESTPTPEERVEAARQTAARRSEDAAFAEPYRAHQVLEIRVANGETLAAALIRSGADGGDVDAAMASISGVYDLRRIRPGQNVRIVFDRRTESPVLTGVSFHSEPGASITANRTATHDFAAREVLVPLTFEIARISAPAGHGVFSTALMMGATDREVAAFADAFARADIDLREHVRPRDDFELVFERFYDDEGNTVRTGDLLFVALESVKGRRAYYSFLPPGESRPDWFDQWGRSAFGSRPLSGRAFELFEIERARVDTLRQVRADEEVK